MNINAIDLFCGVGGLTYGLQQSGINVVAGIDIEKSCEYAYTKNNNSKFYNADIKEISPSFIESLYPTDTDIKVLAGCAPCQPFSSYSYRYKGKDVQKNKMDLLGYFGNIVKFIKPDIVTMENVPQMAKEKIFLEFLSTLQECGYKINWKIVYAPDYGVPQKRKRLVLLACKEFEIKLISPLYNKTNYPTVRDAIDYLPPIKAGETSKNDPLHTAAKLNSINMERIKQSKPGGTWMDWDPKLLPKAYKKKSGQTYKSVYGRMKWDEPGPTITTQYFGYGNGRFGHPEQDRALSLREGALLQTFPKNYVFFPKNGSKKNTKLKIALQIGNAVPVELAKSIGKSIIESVYNNE